MCIRDRVYSVMDGKLADQRAFDWSEDRAAFTEIGLEIED